MDSNTLVITGEGLTRVSRELIDKRKYNKNGITIIGNPIVVPSSGRLAALNTSSYVQHAGMNFSDAESIQISVTALYSLPSDTSTYQCLWSLQDTSVTGTTLSFLVYNNKLELLSQSEALISIENLEIEDNTELNISLQLTSSTYQVVIVTNKAKQVFRGSMTTKVFLSGYSQVQIGRTPYSPKNYWLNSIDLSTFIISKNDSIYYTPSEEPSFKFNKLLISDSSVELEDDTEPMYGHVYEVGITEIDRTNNIVLLKATIGSELYLTINKIGLYVEDENENSELFSEISGLSIKKTSDLDYDLIIKVNTDIGVVNIVALPEIVVTDEDYSILTDFLNIRRVFTYSVTDMERIICMNAINLGYGKELKLLRNFVKAIIWNQNCVITQKYSKLKQAFPTQLENYFPINAYPYDHFKVYNMRDKSYYIEYNSGSLTGNRDSIDFSNELSSTLCVKLKLSDDKDKFLFSKISRTDDTLYFTLEFLNKVLVATLYMSTGEKIVLEKDYNTEDIKDEKFERVLANDMNVIFTMDMSEGNPTLSMYINNTLVGSKVIASKDFQHASDFVIANYESSSSKATTNYVSDILYFDGVLTENQRYFINNLFDTNY